MDKQDPIIEQYDGYKIERYADGTVFKAWDNGARETTWPTGNKRYVDQFGNGWLYTASGMRYSYFTGQSEAGQGTNIWLFVEPEEGKP